MGKTIPGGMYRKSDGTLCDANGKPIQPPAEAVESETVEATPADDVSSEEPQTDADELADELAEEAAIVASETGEAVEDTQIAQSVPDAPAKPNKPASKGTPKGAPKRSRK